MKTLGLELYSKMYTSRRSEQRIIEEYSKDEMKTPMHMSMGQEAIPAAVCQALHPDDQIYATYRSHAAFLSKTNDVERFFAELFGKETGTAQGKSGSMHIADHNKGHMCSSAIVASCVPVAVGASFAQKQRKSGRIACVFFGDGAVDEGSVWESLNVACAMRLPTLFVCEDNNLAVHTASHVRQGYKKLSDVLRAFECNVFESDSTDVENIYHTTKEAISAINSNSRPSFLHIKCYRYLEHVGVSEDFNAGYRSKEEYMEWRKLDSLDMQRKKLLNGGLENTVKNLEAEINIRIDLSIDKARQAACPKIESLYKGVYYEEN